MPNKKQSLQNSPRMLATPHTIETNRTAETDIPLVGQLDLKLTRVHLIIKYLSKVC
jgi:hypothetical protein